MCAIFASASKDKIIELAKLNSSRGSYSYSITGYNPETHRIIDVFKAKGEFNPIILDEIDVPYYICHIQAPTTDIRNDSSIHPATDRGDYLWHNGIIKEDQIREWQDTWQLKEKWDTKWILWNLNTDSSLLSNTDGSFACVWYHKHANNLRIFRNEFTPLFIGMESFDISSTKADGMVALDPNKVVKLNFKNGSISTGYIFTTKNNPYYFGV